MKYLLAFLLLIPFFNVNAQETKPDITSLLCHKWRVTQMASGQKKMNVPANGDYTIFKNDFTHEQKEDGTVRKSTWKYVEASKKITFASGDEYILKEVTPTKLVLTTKMDGMPVDLIFKRFEE